MAYTKQQAKLLAGMMTPESLEALRFICGRGSNHSNVTEKVLQGLVELKLVRRDRTVESIPREVVLLTPGGKKVAEFI